MLLLLSRTIDENNIERTESGSATRWCTIELTILHPVRNKTTILANVDCLIRKMLASDHDNTKEDAIRAPNIHHHREGDYTRPYPREEDDDTLLPYSLTTSHTTPQRLVRYWRHLVIMILRRWLPAFPSKQPRLHLAITLPGNYRSTRDIN